MASPPTQSSDHSTGVRSTVHVLGHPVHPILIPFPIAFLTGAALTDLGFVLDGDDFWSRASVLLLGAGVVTALGAAAVGLVDFLTIERVRAHTTGWTHLSANGLAVGVGAVNWLIRLNGSDTFVDPWGLSLSIVTAMALVVGGWTGGELAYRHKIGVTGHEGANDGHT